MMTKILLALIVSGLFASQAHASAQTPWLNTNIVGAVKDAKYSPNLKDDYYANINHEWLINTTLKPGYPRIASFSELQDEIDARLKGIMTDTGISGHDAEVVRKLYSLWLDC